MSAVFASMDHTHFSTLCTGVQVGHTIHNTDVTKHKLFSFISAVNLIEPVFVVFCGHGL